MKNSIFFKVFTLFFTMIVFVSPVLSSDNTVLSSLSKVEISQADTNSYDINLLFNNKYTGNALMQKNTKDSYFIFIPDAKITDKHLKIVYKNKNDKFNIRISPEESPYLKDGVDSSFVKLTIDLKNNYSLNFYTKTIGKEKGIFSFISFNLFSFIIILFSALIIFMITHILKCTKTEDENNYTFFPSFDENNTDDYSRQGEEENHSTPVMMHLNKSLKSDGENYFSCFDIISEHNLNSENSDKYSSPLKQTSAIFKNRSTNSGQSNPIKSMYSDESLNFDLPAAEDILKPQKEKKINEPELLSKLEITPTKGFYLTCTDNNIALFGYVGKNIFFLKKFSDLSQINLQARFYDRQKNNDIYIVRLDSYKAMIQISDTGMKELAAL